MGEMLKSPDTISALKYKTNAQKAVYMRLYQTFITLWVLLLALFFILFISTNWAAD